jgi:hypothetical protein
MREPLAGSLRVFCTSLSCRSLSVVVVVCAASLVVRADANRWWEHVAALANDSMEGRNTGTAAHARAAAYVGAAMQRAGLQARGTEGYIQTVSFDTRRLLEDRSSLALDHSGTIEPLTLGEDANISVRVDPAASLNAPLVFVGHDLKIPERGIDDLAGVDLKGAIAVYLNGAPQSLPGVLQAHFGSAAERWSAYKAAGAVGTVGIANPKTLEIPWERSTLARLQPAMSLADPALQDTPGQQIAVAWNPARADKLFAKSGHTFAQLLDLADRGQPLPPLVLQQRLILKTAVERTSVRSQNIAGVLRGVDPALRDQYVVVSAHLDHLGVGGAVNGDAIYNGAMDNASGVAAMLESAAMLRDSGAQPARSILFLAVTGEEKGELGSRYFAAHPTVPRQAIVADVNIDMFLPLFPLKKLMVLGLDESDLGADIRATAGELGLDVQADPKPQRLRFVRSDQYSFVRAGIPALAMKVGYDEGSPEVAVARRWTAERYHAPSDDLDQPIDRDAAGKYVDVIARLALRIANRPTRPQWDTESFFRRFSIASAPTSRALRAPASSSTR